MNLGMELWTDVATAELYTFLPNFTGWGFRSMQDCLQYLNDQENHLQRFKNDQLRYCNATWDEILCWPAAVVNRTVRLPCPLLRGLDTTKFAYKKCGEDGHWLGMVPNERASQEGWTNYMGCYTQESRLIYEKLFSKTSSEHLKTIACRAKMMEVAGLSVSLVALFISVLVFSFFRTLRCDRTRMHRHLCVAILIHVTIQLTVSVDTLIACASADRHQLQGALANSRGTIVSTPKLCEALRILVEYSKTVMFTWMFIEGFYLHNMLVVTVFVTKPNYQLYYAIGWGFPLIMTVPWAIADALNQTESCWFGYTFRSYYWILEGPRLAIICVNVFFLLRIVAELVRKLRQNNSPEALKVWKCARAALILLPLLGANNFLVMFEPTTASLVKFGIWSFSGSFLVSCQGFFISLFYCFLNTDVQQTLTKKCFCSEKMLAWRRSRGSSNYSSSRRMQSFTSTTRTSSNVRQSSIQSCFMSQSAATTAAAAVVSSAPPAT